MSKALKKVHEGQKISAEDIKELVDFYNLTQVIVSNSNNDDEANLYTNRCLLYDGKIEFYQSGTFDSTNSIVFNQKDMSNATWNEDEESDPLILKFNLPEEKTLCLLFMNQRSEDDMTDWHETDLDNMMQFMDEALDGKNGYHLSVVNVSDCFALNINFYSSKAFIDTLEDQPKLRVNAQGNTFELYVFDDICNEFQSKENDTMRCFRIHPYGQPFTTVKLLYIKMSSK